MDENVAKARPEADAVIMDWLAEQLNVWTNLMRGGPIPVDRVNAMAPALVGLGDALGAAGYVIADEEKLELWQVEAEASRLRQVTIAKAALEAAGGRHLLVEVTKLTDGNRGFNVIVCDPAGGNDVERAVLETIIGQLRAHGLLPRVGAEIREMPGPMPTPPASPSHPMQAHRVRGGG